MRFPMTTVSGAQARPETDGSRGAQLAVLDDDPSELTVAVSGVPRIYGFGLLNALASAGIRGVLPDSDEQWSTLLDSPEAVVVVVAQESAAAVESRLAASSRSVPVVQVLADLSAERCAQALGDGATGVLLVDADLTEVVSVVQAAAASETLLPHTVATSLCRRTSAAPAPDLRAAELQWMRRLADGWTVASLARQVGYSEREMYRLLNGVYHRLGCTSRTEALLRAQRHGLLDDVAV
jgi:DNA-binding NarL/FixJ family response regulator